MNSFLWFIIIGAAAGWLAGLLTRGSGNGLLVNMLTGIAGGIIGGWLAGQLNIDLHISNPLLNKLVIATGGAVILLLLLHTFRKSK